MKEFKDNVMAILAVIGVIAFSLPAESRERYKRIYSNVTAQDMGQLFNGVAFVGHTDSTNTAKNKNQHAIDVHWFGKNGESASCYIVTKKKYWGSSGTLFSTVDFDAVRRSEKYPLLKYGTNPKKGYRAVKYLASGETILFVSYKNYWWKRDIGHLQERLPAAVWTACPDFPSAASLGAEVNHKQTSTNYMELLQQDRGQRIQRPDLITENTVERY